MYKKKIVSWSTCQKKESGAMKVSKIYNGKQNLCEIVVWKRFWKFVILISDLIITNNHE